MISVSENGKGKGYKEKMTEMSMHSFFPLFSERENRGPISLSGTVWADVGVKVTNYYCHRTVIYSFDD